MARLKGMMSSKRVLILLSAVMIISIAGLFSAFIIAQPDSLTVRVANIENNLTITTANVTLWNCSNPAQMLGYNTTQDGQAYIEVTGAPWNVSIQVNVSGNFINKTDDNGGNCYLISGDMQMTEEVYSYNKGSFNVTVVDSVNGRPVPNVNVSVYHEGSGTADQSYNYRCDDGVCTTGDDGNIMLVLSQSSLNLSGCGNYIISVSDQIPNYDDKNKSVTGPCAGANKDVLVKVKGAQKINGYITDTYNPQMKIEGANVTLWNHSTPSKMFGWNDMYFYNGTTDANGYYEIRVPSDLLCSEERCRYDVKVEAENYLTAYNKSDNNQGWQHAMQIDLSLTGPLTVTGKAIDITNGEPIPSAEVRVYNYTEDFEYVMYTDAQGDFSLKIRNNTGYSVKVSRSGYGDNITTGLTGSQSMGDITMKGKAEVVGKIIDFYPDQSGSDIPLSATISFDSGVYEATSDASGDFSIFVRSGVTYTIKLIKDGYFTSTFSLPVEEDPAGNVSIGTKKLTGKHRIYGTIYDSEGQSRATYYLLAGADVLVHDSYHTYKVTSNGYGYYSINVSSVNNDYYLEFQLGGFDTKIMDNSGGNYTGYAGSKQINTQLVGSTTVTGKVADEYSPTGSTIPLPGATLLFKDHNSSLSPPLYTVTADSNGDFTVNLGVTGDYEIYVSKSGYGSRTFDNLGTGYTAGSDISFNNVTNDYLRLRGTAHVLGVVTDAKSGEYVYNAIVTLYDKNNSQAKYWESVNGSYEFWVDGDLNYELEANADGYPKKRFSGGTSGYNGDLNKDITLTAQFQAILKDAENTAYGIRNSRVRLYHYYDQAYFGPDSTPGISPLNVTQLSVNVSCEERDTGDLLYLDDINVTLIKTDGCAAYQETLGLCFRSQNTTGGATLFDTLAVGTYTMNIDGSQIGCGDITESISFTTDDAGTLMNITRPLMETTLTVRVVDPIWFITGGSMGRLEDANVTIVNPGPYTNTTPDNNTQGVFTFHFVPALNVNVSAYNSDHFLNYTLYNLTPGAPNVKTNSPLILQPYPADLSVLVLNTTGYGVDDGVDAGIANQSELLVDPAFFSAHYSSTYSTTTNGGWANFTGIYPSVYWNLTLNGTDEGYNHTYVEDWLLEAAILNVVNATVRENTLVVHVYGFSGGSPVPVPGAVVTLWAGSIGSSVAQDGTGNDLNGTTNSTGGLLFSRTIPGDYNVSVNGTGFIPFESSLTLRINRNVFNPVLNDTTPPYYDSAWMSPASPEQGDNVRVYVHWVDNAILQQAILQIRYEDMSEENHTYKAFINTDWSNFTLDSAFTNQHAGEDMWWKVIARDSSDNWNTSMPWTQFHIDDTGAPTVSVTHMPYDVVAGMEVVFTATATDNHNVSSMKIYVDYEDKSSEQECNSTGGSSMICTWKSTGFNYDTTHYYYAIAEDDEGNQGKDPAWELNETTSYVLPSGAGRSHGAAVYVGSIYPEKIYIFGGLENGVDVSNQILGFQPRFPANPSLVASMPQSRRSFAAAYDSDNDDIYIFGGTDGSSWLASILRFAVSSEAVSNRTATISPQQRNSPSAAFHPGSGYVYMFGGDNVTDYSQNIWRYDISGDSGSNVGNLPSPRSKTAAVYSPVNDRIYVIGGFNGTKDLADIVEYNPGGAASLVASMPVALEGVTAAYHTPTDRIYIFGGYNLNGSVYSLGIFEFDPQTSSVSTMNTTIPVQLAFASSAFSDYDNKFYLFGGTDNSTYYDEIARYDPVYGKSFTVQIKQGNLTVYVESGGSAVTDCGGWPEVTLSYAGTLPNGKSFQTRVVDATNGQARFENLYPAITYDYDVDGQSQGYDTDSGTVNVGQGENSLIVSLTETDLTINTTNSSGEPVAADFSVYTTYPTLLTTCDGTQLQQNTGGDGLYYYNRVLPCTNCNLTVSKPGATPTWNSALFDVVAGQANYVQIDPPGSGASLGPTYPYYVDAVGDYNTITVNVTTNSTGTPTPLIYVNISFIRDDGTIANSSLTDAFGIAYVMVKDGVYNLSVDGQGRGYDSMIVENLKIGKLVFANGTTDSNGQVLLVVDGQPMYTPLDPHTPSGGYGYFARIETAGYGDYDSLADGIGIFEGTYWDDAKSAGNNDVNDSFTLDMYGLSMINGTVKDKHCVYSNCRVPSVGVSILVGVQGQQVRYSEPTDINGTFSFHVSPYTPDSYWNNPINVSYDLKATKGGYVDYYASGHGYTQGIKLSEYENLTHDPKLNGDGLVAGYILSNDDEQGHPPIIGADVKFVATSSPPANPNILPNSNYYSTVSGAGGYFSMIANPNYAPYKISVETDNATFLSRTVGPYSSLLDDIIVYLYKSGEGGMHFEILDEYGQGIEGVNIKVSAVGLPTVLRTTNQSGLARIWSIDGGGMEYDVTINGSYLGYGVIQTTATVDSGDETQVSLTLPATKINVTLISDTGENVDGVTVSLRNASGLLAAADTENGSAVFSVLLPDQYTIDFAGYQSLVYYMNGETLSSNVTSVELTWNDAGKTANITYVLNETRLRVGLIDYNSSALPNITVTITNTSGNGTLTYVAVSDSNGYALFREILPAHNYSITFNETELNSMGLQMQLEDFSIGVFGGEDEYTTNNITIVVGDVYVRFNVTDYLGNGIENVTISLEIDGSIAVNGYNETLNGTTDSSGILVIHGVPNRTYSFTIDGNLTGYGIWNGSVAVTLDNDNNKVYISGLRPIMLTVFVYDESMGPLSANVTVSVYIGGSLAMNGNGQYLVANATSYDSSVDFSNLLVYGSDYTVMTSSQLYFPGSGDVGFGLMNPSVTHENLTFALSERSLTILVRYQGSVLSEGVNISLVNSTDGSPVTGTNGSVIGNKTGITDSTVFEYIPDGIYNITVNSLKYFNPAPLQFNTSEIPLGKDSYTINFTAERTITVIVREVGGGTLTEGVNISIQNSTGDVVISLNGSYLSSTGVTDSVDFTHVPDGQYMINITSDKYFSQNLTFTTLEIQTDNTRTFTMQERILTVSIYHLPGDVITEDVTVSLVNVTGDVVSNTTGQPVTGTTDTGTITFTGLLNGEYNVTIVSANYTPQNISFIPASGDNNEVDAYLLMIGHGYFNVTVLTTGGSPLSGATVTMRHNGTTSVDSRATGSDGIAIVSANTTLYSQNLSARATRSGYYDNETAQYALSDQEIKDIVITLKAEPSSPYSPPGGGPSGSSIGGVVSETKDFGDIAANVAKSAKFSLADLHSIDEIEILTDQNANDVSVTVRQSGKPSGAPDPISSTDGKVQKYLEITATNLPDSIIRRVTITFKVSKTWVDNNGIDPNGMYMFRYSGGAWDRLSTSLISEDDRWYYYRSTSPGFSIFAIGGYKIGLGRMELTMSTVSLKGNECRTAYISVKNALSTTLTNLHVDPVETECCTIEQLSGISSLAYGAQDSIAIQICSGTMTERGTYDYSITVISDQARESISSKIYVTESYAETLTRQIEELENRLAGLDMSELNSTEMAYYDLALEKIEGSREYLSRQDFDGALTMLGEAREYFDKIQVGGPAEKGYLEMMLDWIMLNYILASVIGAIIVLALSGVFIKWKVISKQLPEMPDVPMPSGGEVVGAIKKSPADIMDSIMAVVDELEARVDDMDIESLRESERKWYNKVKLQIEKIKKSVDSGDMDKAKRNLNDAELFMKMLELNAAG